MDPATATFISIFGPALWKVFETLLEKGKDQLLDQGFASFKEWIEGGYQTRKQEEKLRQTILDALCHMLPDKAGVPKYKKAPSFPVAKGDRQDGALLLLGIFK